MTTTIDLADTGFKSLSTTGSMQGGSSQLTVASSAGFKVGDQIIIAVGGEAGHGQRGTVGVGGVYAATTSDPGQYYTSQDAPKALVAHVIGIGSDGHTLLLDKAASTSTTSASVYFDNKPVWDATLAANTAPNVTLKIPEGHFAISSPLELNWRPGWTVDGAGKAKTELFSPDGAPSASFSVFQADHVTLQNFTLTGNARLNGYGLGDKELYPSGIMFTSAPHGTVQDITVNDVFQNAVGTRYSDDTWAYRVDAHLTDGLARYIQWQFGWSNSKGGGVVDSSLDSPTLTNGFEGFASEGVSFIGIKGTNASMSMNSSGNFTIKDPVLIVTDHSWVSDTAFHKNNPLININSNINHTDPLLALGGQIINATMIQEGYINNQGNLLTGISINPDNTNILVKGGIYISPDTNLQAMDRGAAGVTSTGHNTVVDGFKVVGAGYFNITVTDGVVKNSVASSISAPAGHTDHNGQPDAALTKLAADTVWALTHPVQPPASVSDPAPVVNPGPPSDHGNTPSSSDLLHLGSLAYSTSSVGGQVYALYGAILDRAPTILEMESQVAALKSGKSLQDISQTLIDSAEGHGKLASGTNTAFVESLYQTALHRGSDAGGLEYWTGLLNHGASRADVALGFALSGEKANGLAPQLAGGIFVPDADAMDAARLYYGVLGRAPEEGGLAGWTATLKSGVSLHDVTQSFLTSTEFTSSKGSLNNTDFVDSLYTGALGRHAETGGLQYWTSLLEHGTSKADVALGISDSLEAQHRFAGMIESGWHLSY